MNPVENVRKILERYIRKESPVPSSLKALNPLTTKSSQNLSIVLYGAMDSSAPFPLFSSLRVVGDMNGRPLIPPLRVPLMTTCPTAFSPHSEQQPAEIRPTSMEVVWPV
ncbi:hypothetical protein AVEN_226453-1 [Araneus ventricosus]|uniref:Uncharacterized protein n=1 Tax=Araneus ventricosus TaxID=182803 RepID=A0A4Y2MLE0_ARAVE|nr:hypothetical protein AVEN_226453-1 [Araneus ventricosus]